LAHGLKSILTSLQVSGLVPDDTITTLDDVSETTIWEIDLVKLTNWTHFL